MDSSQWLALPERRPVARPRAVVVESWDRARQRHLDPERLLPALEVAEDSIVDVRTGHPLAAVLPVIRRLLVNDAEGSGLLVAVGDEHGRLLWVEGDPDARRRAEEMRFVAGAGWAEDRVGTSAPGTALALDHGIQIHDDEHFNRLVHGWSCTAVPVHDPETRRILGVIDITGDERAVDPHALPLMEATAAAAEAELLVMRLRQRAAAADASSAPVSIPLGSPASRGASAARGVAARAQARARAGARSRARTTRTSAVLHVLGRDTGDLELPDGGSLELSARHAEIVTLLAWHREGLAADLLTDLVYGENGSSVTLRAEIVRLRRALEPAGIELASRPYRLGGVVELDLHRVVSLLDRGAHRVALAGYGGGPLPGSDAPGILEIRADVGVRMREALLAAASPDVLLAYAATREGADDVDVLRELLRVLPPRSPRRAALVARLEQLERSER
ncbi:GAF domain-containing protein [Cnuibacter sp. UC19_7]|uniref:GAF domain-containing protein n=1 Tax=Cnuibacter sp. UC19_7 TaxID=3350166 RepID=UPI00366A8ADB